MKLKNKEIAQILGISPTAVSLAINNRPGVSEETREKVLRLLNDSIQEDIRDSAPPAGEPPAKSDSLFKGTILMNIHKSHGTVIIDKPFFSDLIEAAQQESMAASYIFSVVNFLPGQDLHQHLNYIKVMNPSGILLVATELTDDDLKAYESLQIPIVLLDASFDLSEDIDSVSLDNTLAIFRAFHYAYELGHRNIGYLQSEVQIKNFLHRMDGFQKGIREYHLEDYTHTVVSLPPDIEGARKRMSDFLDQISEPEELPSVFLSDLDYIALGAMQALKDHGYRIPEDVSLIGFDDITPSALSDPPLTTIRVNHGDIARIASDLLLKRIQTGKPSSYHTMTQVLSKLVIRKSVKNLNQTPLNPDNEQ